MSKPNTSDVDLGAKRPEPSAKQAAQVEKEPEETSDEKRCKKIARLLIELFGTICPRKQKKAT